MFLKFKLILLTKIFVVFVPLSLSLCEKGLKLLRTDIDTIVKVSQNNDITFLLLLHEFFHDL